MASNLVCSEPKKQCISRTTRYRLRKESKCISSDFNDSTHRELEATEYDDSTLQDYYDHQTGHNLDGSFHNPTDHHQSCIVLDEAEDNHLANHSDCIDCREPDYHMYCTTVMTLRVTVMISMTLTPMLTSTHLNQQ